MRAKSQWTPGSIVLWLIAAILATLVVCSDLPPPPDEADGTAGTTVEFEIVE